MSKTIDVKQLAIEIKGEFDDILQTKIANAIAEAKSKNLKETDLLADLVFIAKTNSELFAVALIQKVVDELSKE